MWQWFQKYNFQVHFIGQYFGHLLWNCSQVNVREPYLWQVNIGSGSGLVPPGYKPLSAPRLTQIHAPYGVTRPQRVNAKSVIGNPSFNPELANEKTSLDLFGCPFSFTKHIYHIINLRQAAIDALNTFAY